MYARNMEKLLLHVSKDAALTLDAADPIIKAMLIVRDGTIVHEQIAASAAATTAPIARKELAA